ncbi:MAG: hypothetical protein JWO48_3194 [Bryobacterales bacterium]|nr:hypothetical protein [Bryobacterales bacterium]
MVLTKDELIKSLQSEVRILLHLISKVKPTKLDYRPTAKQRSMLELLQYMVIVGPIHLRAVMAGAFDMDAWRNTWRTQEAGAKAMNLEEVKEAIGKQPALFAELLGSCSDADLRANIEMFGSKASRGSMIVSLVLCHYTAYRMQLFLYLKGCGREELNTMNLWVGKDAA